MLYIDGPGDGIATLHSAATGTARAPRELLMRTKAKVPRRAGITGDRTLNL